MPMEGFHVVCGTSPKNGINGVMPNGIRSYRIGDENDRTLDLSGFNSLLVADLDYFVEHHEEIMDMVKEMIEYRKELGDES